MHKLYSNSSAAIFYFASYATAIIAILWWHTLVSLIFTASLIFIPAAWILSTAPITRQHTTTLKKCLTLWGLQSIGFVLTLLLAVLWFAQFPDDHNRAMPDFAKHPSLSLIFSSFFLSCLLIMFCTLSQRRRKPISILLFFSSQKKTPYLANLGNFWFLRATMLPSLLLFLLACQILLAPLAINKIAVLTSILLMGIALRLPWIYRALQIMIKRWQFNFMSLLLLFFIAAIPCSFFIQWLMQAFGPMPSIHFNMIGYTAPLVLFWSVAIALTIPLAYTIASKITYLSPRTLFFFCLTNPFLWLIFILDYHAQLLNHLLHLPTAYQNILSLFALCISFFWLRSSYLAKLSQLFFGHFSQFQQNVMPRNLVLRNFSLLFFLLLGLLLQATFILQIELLVTGFCTLISCIIAVYLFLYRAPHES